MHGPINRLSLWKLESIHYKKKYRAFVVAAAVCCTTRIKAKLQQQQQPQQSEHDCVAINSSSSSTSLFLLGQWHSTGRMQPPCVRYSLRLSKTCFTAFTIYGRLYSIIVHRIQYGVGCTRTGRIAIEMPAYASRTFKFN